jgi:epoxide hydrolase-like predicted phosphatase
VTGDSLEAAIFDYGGVMAKSPIGRVHMLAEEFNAEPNLLMSLILGGNESYGNPWFEAECGRQPLDSTFAREMQKILDPYGITFDLGIFLPWVAEAQNEPDELMDEAVKWLKKKGIPVALLTNAVPEFRPVIEKTVPIYELFDVIVDSSEVGFRKPDCRIYELTAQRLGVPTESCLMVDDLLHNVTGAEKTGMTGIHFKNAQNVLREIQDRF